MRPLHESHFTCMLRRLKAPTVGKIVLNRSFISINSLIPCVFALPESEIIFRAKVSMKYQPSRITTIVLIIATQWFLIDTIQRPVEPA